MISTAHARSTSDVQEKVAQFNNLTKEAAQRRKDNEAALRRAVLGREEAENETRRIKDENESLRRDIEEGRNRERRVGERLEGVMVGLNAEACDPLTNRRSGGAGQDQGNPGTGACNL